MNPSQGPISKDRPRVYIGVILGYRMGYILGYLIGYLVGYTLNPEAFTATESQLTSALERVRERTPTMISISSPEIVPAFTRLSSSM